MITARKTNRCRYCGSSRLTRFLSLGEQPPSNSFIRSSEIASEQSYPLDVAVCETCWLVQLLDTVPPEATFDDYLYLSSTSKALVAHYHRLAQSLVPRFHLAAGDVVVDIGCNDGALLRGYPADLVRVGVEPSKVVELLDGSGIHPIKAFFGADAAQRITSEFGRAKVVTATNVFAHVDDVASFVSAMVDLLDDDGVFVIEAPYLVDLIDQTLFDTIYHEHLAYLSLTPVVAFLKTHGLTVVDVERVPFGASGPAIRVFSSKSSSRPAVGPAIRTMLRDEADWGIGRIDRYTDYAQKVEGVKARLLELLENFRRSGARIGGFGAPAKGNTLLNYVGITPDLVTCIADNNEWKQGRVTPGSHIPVVSDAEFLAWQPDYALLLTWNYLDFFLEHSDYIRRGGRFIVPLPEPRVVP